MRNDLKDFKVHRIREDKEDNTPTGLTFLPDEGEMGFTIKGRQINVESGDCFCKVLVEITQDKFADKLVSYFIKVGISGFMFNPWGMYQEGHQHKEANHLGRKAWTFHKVTEACFQNYFKFMQSRNKAWLSQAEREIR